MSGLAEGIAHYRELVVAPWRDLPLCIRRKQTQEAGIMGDQKKESPNSGC